MQFDHATNTYTDDGGWVGGRGTTSFDAIVAKYTAAGYTMPGVVFWNLRAPKVVFKYPVLHTAIDCALISGFNVGVVNDLLSGKEMSPMALVQRLVNNPRYDAIRL